MEYNAASVRDVSQKTPLIDSGQTSYEIPATLTDSAVRLSLSPRLPAADPPISPHPRLQLQRG